MPKWIQWFGYDYQYTVYIYTLHIIFIKICFRAIGCIFFLDLLALKVVSLGSPWAIGLYLWGTNNPAKNFGNERFQMMIFLSVDEFQTSFSRCCVHVRVLFLPSCILVPIPKKQADRNVLRMMCLSLWHLCMGPQRESGGNANSAVKSFKELGECCWFFLVGPYFLYLGGRKLLCPEMRKPSTLSKRGRLQTGFSTKSASGTNWQIERFQFEFVCNFWKLIN